MNGIMNLKRTARRIISILLACMLIFGAVSAFSTSADADDEFNCISVSEDLSADEIEQLFDSKVSVDGSRIALAADVNGTEYANFADAVAAFNAADNATLRLLSDIDVEETVSIEASGEFDLNGFILNANHNDCSVITVKEDCELVVSDSDPDAKHYISENDDDEDDEDDAEETEDSENTQEEKNGAYTVANYSNGFEKYDVVCGGIITGGKGTVIGTQNRHYGGAIYLKEGSALTLKGGNICGNDADFYGGGIYADNADVVMQGGSVSYNKAKACGGGICGENGSNIKIQGGILKKNVSDTGAAIEGYKNVQIEMTDGTITENEGEWYGVVDVGYSSFTMNGGAITNNNSIIGVITAIGDFNDSGEYNDSEITINGGSIDHNYAIYGALYVGNTGMLTMNGGSVCNNGKMSNGSPKGGTGVYVNYRTKFVMNGGTISKNFGGGVRGRDRSEITLNGGEITENIANNGAGVLSYGSVYIGSDIKVKDNILTEGGVGQNLCLVLSIYGVKGVAYISGKLSAENKIGVAYLEDLDKDEKSFRYTSGIFAKGADGYTITDEDFAVFKNEADGIDLRFDAENNAIVFDSGWSAGFTEEGKNKTFYRIDYLVDAESEEYDFSSVKQYIAVTKDGQPYDGDFDLSVRSNQDNTVVLDIIAEGKEIGTVTLVLKTKFTAEVSGEYIYNGSEQTVNYTVKMDGQELDLKYYEALEIAPTEDSVVSATEPGKYTLTIEIANLDLVLEPVEWTIQKAAQQSPGENESRDRLQAQIGGKIAGLTTEMEYRKDGESEYTAVTDTEMIFAAGVYYIRYAENALYQASDDVKIVIESVENPTENPTESTTEEPTNKPTENPTESPTDNTDDSGKTDGSSDTSGSSDNTDTSHQTDGAKSPDTGDVPLTAPCLILILALGLVAVCRKVRVQKDS